MPKSQTEDSYHEDSHTYQYLHLKPEDLDTHGDYAEKGGNPPPNVSLEESVKFGGVTAYWRTPLNGSF